MNRPVYSLQFTVCRKSKCAAHSKRHAGRKLRILVTAGPTREPVDPVRYISNRSTGKMGIAIAKEAKERGHSVILIHGPLEYVSSNGIKGIEIETAREMEREVKKRFNWCDCLIMAAAVSDYRPRRVAREKIRRNGSLVIEFTENPDILKGLGERKKNKILVGFALETGELLESAKRKLREKNLDIIVANRISERISPFGEGRNSYAIINRDAACRRVGPMKKDGLASILVDAVEKMAT